jgi:DNA-binding transcriptional regulator YdaS (Cro superfamily)
MYLDRVGITQNDFAKVIGMPPASFKKLITGHHKPTLENAKLIEEATNGAICRFYVLYPNEFISLGGSISSAGCMACIASTRK